MKGESGHRLLFSTQLNGMFQGVLSTGTWILSSVASRTPSRVRDVVDRLIKASRLEELAWFRRLVGINPRSARDTSASKWAEGTGADLSHHPRGIRWAYRVWGRAPETPIASAALHALVIPPDPSATPDPQPLTLRPQPSILDLRSSTLNFQTLTLDP